MPTDRAGEGRRAIVELLSASGRCGVVTHHLRDACHRYGLSLATLDGVLLHAMTTLGGKYPRRGTPGPWEVETVKAAA